MATNNYSQVRRTARTRAHSTGSQSHSQPNTTSTPTDADTPPHTAQPTKAYVYFDGAHHNGKNRSGIGYQVQDDHGNIVEKGGMAIHADTSMEAELIAFKHAVTAALNHDFGDITVITDCQGAKDLVNGDADTSNDTLADYVNQIQDLLAEFTFDNVAKVDRELNPADGLAGNALDNAPRPS